MIQIFRNNPLLVLIAITIFAAFINPIEAYAQPSVTCLEKSMVLDNLNVSETAGSSNAIFSEGFEYNNDSDLIAWPHNSNWNTLTNTDTGSAVVSVNYANGGSKSLKIIQEDNFVLKLGEKTSGTFLVKWKMYVPTGASAAIYFSKDTSSTDDICGLLYNNGNSAYTNELTGAFLGMSSFTHNHWVDVVSYFNLNTDRVLVLVDDTVKVDFSGDDFNLGAINFTQGGSGFYIDDIEFQDLSLTNNAINFNSATDNIAIYADPLYFDCSNVGLNTVTLKAIDLNGNVGSCQSSVNLKDIEDPEIPILNDVLGQCSATASVPTTVDNCSGTIIGTTSDNLTYTTQGTHVITWNFDDNNGNSINVNQNVIIDDTTAPIADNSNLSDITEQCSSTPPTPTASDNCDGSINATCPTTFPITETTTITWTYTDSNGNASTQNQNIIINDTIDPIADTTNLSEITAEGSVTPPTPTASDNCDGSINATCPTTFPITETTTITWTYTDNSGNITSQDQSIVIVESQAPVPNNISDVFAECSASPEAPTAVDNFDGIITAYTGTVFPVTETSTIVWIYKDHAGNTTTQNQEIIILDNTEPEIICPENLEITLEDVSMQSVKISKDELNYISCSDNCSIASITSSIQNFSELDSVTFVVGTTLLNWTATDMAQNQSSCYSEIKVNEALNTDVVNASGGESLSIFPNPNNGLFTINYKSTNNKIYSIKVVDVTGKVIYNENLNNTTGLIQKRININGVPSGIYYILINTSNSIHKQSIIIN